jgi:hypothetical protein
MGSRKLLASEYQCCACRFFMDNRSLHIDELGEEAIRAQMESFILNMPDEQVNDDKTIAVIINASAPAPASGL